MNSNKTREIILGNIRILQNKHCLETYEEFGNFTKINPNTIKSWFASKGGSPKLTTLDSIADCFSTSTSELLKLNNDKMLMYKFKNNSRINFGKNFKVICLRNKIYSRKELYEKFEGKISKYTIDSYLRDKNPIVPPIKTLDLMAKRLNAQVYEFVKPEDIIC